MHHAALILHSPIALKTQNTKKQQMRHSLHRLQLDIPRQTTTDCTAQSPKKIKITTTSRRHRRRVGIRRYLTTIYIRRILLHAAVLGIALRKPYIWEFQKRKIGSTALTYVECRIRAAWCTRDASKPSAAAHDPGVRCA